MKALPNQQSGKGILSQSAEPVYSTHLLCRKKLHDLRLMDIKATILVE